MNLYDFNTINRILTSHGFTFSKALGQNFIIDSEVCPEMASHLAANDKTGVIEIGPGIGVLTKELCQVAGKVIAIELDKRLFPVLDETLSEFSNLEIIEGDALKLDLNALIAEKFSNMSSVKVCANLPYYITTPIIMRFLEGDFRPQSLTIMIQKEVAERLTAKAGTADYGAITAAVELYANTKITRIVGKNNFYPVPKVDSSVIRLDICDNKYDCNKEKVKQIIKAAFAMRRKTLVNNLMALGVSRDVIENTLQNLGKDVRIRGEVLYVQDFIDLAENLL